MSDEGIPEIVRRAMVETIVSIGQLSDSDKRILDRYVKRGWLSKGKGGPFPRLKTVYACPTFDFAADRKQAIAAAMAICDIEQQLRDNGYFDPQSPNYGVSLTSKGARP